MSAKNPTMAEQFRVLGTCGCKDRCVEDDCYMQKPNRLGVCEMAAEEAGLIKPQAEEGET